MAKAIVIHEYGGVEKLKFVEIAESKPAANELRVRHTAIGVNYIDIYYRTGLYKPALPSGLGVEAAGVVEAVGDSAQGFAVGDRIAYGTATGALGAYATHRNINSDFAVKLPNYIDDATAAAIMLKGLTAHMLCQKVVILQAGWNVLVHAAAGGVGTLLAQWAKFAGCNVIGTVGSEAKKEWVLKNGCEHAINYSTENFAAQVAKLTNEIGAHVVYDGVGAATFAKSIECLAAFGLLCSYGQSSGKIAPFDVLGLSKTSSFITRPTIANYISEPMALRMNALEVFMAVKENVLRPHISHKIPLAEVAEAHRLLESRKTIGSIVLVV